MTYRCPICKSVKKTEERETIDGVLFLTVKYEDGCFMKYGRRGNSWKLINEVCIRTQGKLR